MYDAITVKLDRSYNEEEAAEIESISVTGSFMLKDNAHKVVNRAKNNLYNSGKVVYNGCDKLKRSKFVYPYQS